MSTIRNISFGLLALFAAVTAADTSAAAQQPTKPNIVFVLMDNLGYGEIGVRPAQLVSSGDCKRAR